MNPPRFIDTHCHFDFPPFLGEEQQSLRQAAAAGIDGIVVPSVAAARFADVLALAERHPMLHAALGLHPIAIEQHQDADVDLLEQHLRQHRARLTAVGEIGLDTYMPQPQLPRQLALLSAQLRLAARYDLPVILHSRRTHDRLAKLLRTISVPRTGVVHGFAGSYQQADAFRRLGYYLGVGGTITYARASKTRDVMARLPLSCLLLETDAPDMPLSGYQGQPNRPERIRQTFAALCDLRREPPAEIAETLYHNSLRLFGLRAKPAGESHLPGAAAR
ncbi:TatD-related deoxyribonuclease [Sodalis praecaptivus]|uniref:TatD-related deoxyribonuclease n=1 Tax=Sodalis praecaptivus TaxID=1239307 RepID=W0I1T6_9GAMM|nr:TatD family hydrolase [Sodalis praecaptivus]AHF78420.1 TatD-related deoxyribonuclease [Sodalis praecaptivus]